LMYDDKVSFRQLQLVYHELYRLIWND